VVAYVRGDLAAPLAWSIEAHLPACASCRAALESELDQARLSANRASMLVALALSDSGKVERLVTRCGVPPHLWRLLSVTPSLRRCWFAGIAAVLVTTVGAAHLGAHVCKGPCGLLPFLLLAPLLPLAGVAAAFHPRLDPAAALATAAPVSCVRLFYVRSVAVIAAALGPTVLAAFALPGGKWLAVLVVLPALAVSAAALALATVVGPVSAATVAGVGWVVVATGYVLEFGPMAMPFGGCGGQAVSAVVIIGACCVLVARRRSLQLVWQR
jgi:hypothetical protein